MIKRSIQVSALIGLLLITGCDRANNVPAVAETPLVGKLYPDRSLFVYSYDKAFAQRFALPEEKALTLSPGLKAMAIEARPTLGRAIECYVHLYLDDTIKPFMPQNKINYTRTEITESVFVGTSSAPVGDFTDDKDSEWRNANFTDNRAIYRTKSGLGDILTLDYEQYKHHFLPELSLLTLKVSCLYLGDNNLPSEIIFQKAGTGDYLLGHDDFKKLHNENTYVFDIPSKLQQHFNQYVRFLDNYNFTPKVNDRIDLLHPTVELP